MDHFGQINWEEMLGDLMVTTFLILLATSIVVVCLIVILPLIDLAFKEKAKPTPRPSQVETWQYDGRHWLALNHRERITPLIDRSKVRARTLKGASLILDHKGTLADARFEISNPSTNSELQPTISDSAA